jgi:hypothetical protein
LENRFNLGWAALAGLGALALVLSRGPQRPAWAVALAVLLAVDVAGGVGVNASPAARAWWHRPGQGPRQLLLFTAAHVHPFVVAAAFGGDLRAAATLYLGNLVAVGVVAAAPRPLQRALALVLAGLLVALVTAVAPPVPGLEWFAPLLVLKLVAAHAPADWPVTGEAGPGGRTGQAMPGRR